MGVVADAGRARERVLEFTIGGIANLGTVRARRRSLIAKTSRWIENGTIIITHTINVISTTAYLQHLLGLVLRDRHTHRRRTAMLQPGQTRQVSLRFYLQERECEREVRQRQ